MRSLKNLFKKTTNNKKMLLYLGEIYCKVAPDFSCIIKFAQKVNEADIELIVCLAIFKQFLTYSFMSRIIWSH